MSLWVAFYLNSPDFKGDLTSSYVYHFNHITWPSQSVFSKSGSHLEKGFEYVLYFFKNFFDYQAMVFVINFVTLWVVIRFYDKYSTNLLLAISCYVYFFTQYNLGAIRELLAYSLLLWGTYNWLWQKEGKNNVRNDIFFIITLVVAVTLHRSALIGLVYYMATKVKLSKNFYVILCALSFVIYVFSRELGNLVNSFYTILVPAYQQYALGHQQGHGTILLFYIAVTMCYLIFNDRLKDMPQYNFIRNILVVGCCVFSLFFEYGFVGRATVYFFIFLPIAITHMNTKLYKPLPGLLGFAGFFVLSCFFLTYGMQQLGR